MHAVCCKTGWAGTTHAAIHPGLARRTARVSASGMRCLLAQSMLVTAQVLATQRGHRDVASEV
jgi:hypothetical protein